MADTHKIDVDLVALKTKPEGEDNKTIRMLGWGDRVRVLEELGDKLKVETVTVDPLEDGSIKPRETTGYIKKSISVDRKPHPVAIPEAQSKVLKLDFVDVQQGDGTVVETPKGKVILVDGGELILFARYLAARFRGTSKENPKRIDAIIVSHGDADHFAGLTEISKSEGHEERYKQIWINPRRVFHNGLVKRTSTGLKDLEMFGETKPVGDDQVIVELEDNLLDVSDEKMNDFFKAWKKALVAWNDRDEIEEFRRIAKGEENAFEFLEEEDIKVEVLGPLMTKVDETTEGLRFLGTPREGPEIGHSFDPDARIESGAPSDSHTVNGHSIVLRFTYGGWRILFAGDLNIESEQDLTAEHNRGQVDLRSEVFKVPHHGSAEFSRPFLRAVSPAISIVSSGDELGSEHIHPRATLVNALGKTARETAAVVFVTEMVAFFGSVGKVKRVNAEGEATGQAFWGFKRAAWGIVRVRTDGERLLVYTDSAELTMKEAYAFAFSPAGEVIPARVRKAT